MSEPTDQEIIDYVADMAGQLALMCGERLPIVALLLRAAARVAKDRIDEEPDDCIGCLS